MTNDAELLVEQADGIALLTLNRPSRRNAVTVRMCDLLFEALQRIARSDASVLILRGAGSDFSVGADFDVAPAAPDPRPALERHGDAYQAATLLHTMPQVTIAAIDGGCAGAAMGWACACDLRFASDRARFNTGFLSVGASGDMGLAWSLLRILGGARARELLLFPEKIDAGRALSLGLVTRMFAADMLFAQTRAAAETLAAAPAFSLRTMKANLVSAEILPMREYVELETARHLHVAAGGALRDRLAGQRGKGTIRKS